MKRSFCLPASTKWTLALVTFVLLLISLVILWFYNKATKQYDPPLLESFTVDHDGQTVAANTIAITLDGKTLAIGSIRGVTLWDLSSGKETVLFVGQGACSLVFNPDGTILATRERNGRIRLWDWNQKKELVSFAASANSDWPDASGANSIAFTLDGKTLVSTGKGEAPGLGQVVYPKGFGKVDLWSVLTGEKQRTLTGHSTFVHAVALSPDGAALATADQDGNLKLWDTTTWKVRSGWKAKVEDPGYGKEMVSITFSPDSKTLASGANHDLELRDVASGTLRESLHEDGILIRSLAFSPDGKTLAAACGFQAVLYRDPGRVQIWNLEHGKRRSIWWKPDPYAAASSVVFSPDSKTLVSTSGIFVRRWDVSAIPW